MDKAKEGIKLLAYRDQYGYQLITPLEAKRIRMSKGEVATFYSRHSPGQRLKMHVKRSSKGTLFFAYAAQDVHRTHVSNPESLTHTLVKSVLRDMAKEGVETVLEVFHRYQHWANIPIRLTQGHNEYTVEAEGHQFIIDTYCQFESIDPEDFLSSYQCRWNGQIAFEIWHSNSLAATDPKCTALEKLGIPILQIAATKKSFAYIDEAVLAELDDEALEAKLMRHRNMIRKVFSQSIRCVLFNNPESTAYSEAQLLKKHIIDLEAEIKTLNTLQQETAQSLLEQTDMAKRYATEKNDLLFEIGRLNEKVRIQTACIEELKRDQEKTTKPVREPFWRRWLR